MKQNTQNSARGTNVTNNETEHIQNSSRDTNATNNQTEYIQNSERDKRNKESNRTHSKQCVKTKATNNKTYETVSQTLT